MENLIHIDPVAFVTCVQCHAELETEGLPTFSTIICPQCGVEAVVHGQLGNFTLTRMLGSGGMGAVYEAVDKVLHRAVAIKVMNKRLGENKEFLDNFLREAQATAHINHPSVVQIYSFGQENGMPYIVMELVSGGSFDKLIEGRGGKIDAALALRVGLEVAEGLKCASNEGLVHGDVKPENILLDENGQAKLVDFGIASLSGNQSDEIWGTPYYIAPEKVRRQKTDFRADIYSLGATLFHAIAGLPPFEGKDSIEVVKARLNKPAPSLTAVLTSVDAEAAAIIDRTLQAEPAQRYPTYESLIGDMRRYVDKASPKNTLSKRVVIKGKSSTSTQNAAAVKPTTGSLAINTDPPPKKKGIVLQKGIRSVAAATPASPAIAAAADSPKKKSNGLLIGLLVGISLFVLLIVAGGVAFWISTSNKAKKEAAEEARREAELNTAATGLRNAAKQAATLSQQTRETLAAATSTVHRIDESVVTVLGPFIRDHLVPSRAPKPANVNTQDVETASAPAPEEFPGDTLGVVPSVREMHLNLFVIQDAAKHTAEIASSADGNLFLIHQDPKAGAISNATAAVIAQLNAYDNNDTIGPKAVADAARRIEDAAKVIDQKCKQALDAKAKAREAALKAEADQKAEAERLAQTNARLQAISDERERVRAAAEQTIALCKEFDFTAARRVLRDFHDLKYDESKADLAFAQNRVDRLETFQKFLIDRVADYQPPGQNWRITAPSNRYLTINGKEIRWTALESIQMFILIRNLISDEKQARQLPLRERANLRLNAALYIHLYMRDTSPIVVEEGNKLRQLAAKDLPSLEQEAEQLLGPVTEPEASLE